MGCPRVSPVITESQIKNPVLSLVSEKHHGIVRCRLELLAFWLSLSSVCSRDLLFWSLVIFFFDHSRSLPLLIIQYETLSSFSIMGQVDSHLWSLSPSSSCSLAQLCHTVTRFRSSTCLWSFIRQSLFNFYQLLEVMFLSLLRGILLAFNFFM